MKTRATRRSFLSAAGIAGLGAAAPPLPARIETTPWGIKLGIASYSLRKFDRARAIAMIKELGTPWASIKDFHLGFDSTPQQRAEWRHEFEAAGLRIMSGGNITIDKDDDASIRRAFEYAKDAGMPMMVCAPTHSNLRAIERFVKEYDIRIAIHNHGPEDKNFPTPQSVLEALRGFDPRCGLCLDAGHTARTGADVVQSVAQAGPRLLDMHVKDLRSMSEKESQCDVGDGDMPFPALFKQLKQMNYQGCVNLEYEINADDPMPGMQRSMSYMRGVLAGLAAA